MVLHCGEHQFDVADFTITLNYADRQERTYRFIGGPWNGREVDLVTPCDSFELTHRRTGYAGRYRVDPHTGDCRWETDDHVRV